MFAIAGFSFAGSGQNTGMAFIRLKDWTSARAPGQTAPPIADRATMALLRPSAMRRSSPSAACGAGARQRHRLRPADGGPRQSRSRGAVAARNQLLGMAATAIRCSPRCAPTAWTTRRSSHRHRPGQGRRAGLALADINSHPRRRLGRHLHQRLHRSRPRQARLYAGRRALSHDAARTSDRWHVRNVERRRWRRSRPSPPRAGRTGPPQLTRYNGLPVHRNQGAGAPGVSPATAMDEMEKLAQQLPQDVGIELTGPVLSGSSCPAARRPRSMRCHPGDLPVPRGAVRKLGDPALGDAGDPAGRDRRGAGRLRAAGLTTTSISRSACSPPSACRPRTPS